MGLTKQIEYKNVVLKAKSNKKYSSVQNYHTLKFSKIPKNHLSFIKKKPTNKQHWAYAYSKLEKLSRNVNFISMWD